MNHKLKGFLMVAVLMAVLLLAVGCGANESQYQINDAENYTVSVKFDANGGEFTTNTTVIVDAYDITKLPVDAGGNVSLALITPDNAARGQNDAHTATRAGHFLAGWYAERTGEEGSYTYGKKWNFETDRLSVPAGQTHTSAEPVLTLYAVWVPAFQIEFYARDTGELLQTSTFNPTEGQEFQMPCWDAQTGTLEMYKFPQRSGYTFTAAYYDAEGTRPVDTETFVHPGSVDETTGVAQNPVLKLYTDWREGQWYRIYTAEQFLDNASVAGHYEICADLDFAGLIWPTGLMHGSFTGTVEGNGHIFKNITLTQTNNSKINTGLFGSISESAVLSDVTFQNVELTVQAGTRLAGASFGVLAGVISSKAQLTGVALTDSRLVIDSSAYFGTSDYAMGLVAGMGGEGIDHSGITASVLGEKLWAVTHADGAVTLTDTQPEQPETVPEETVPEETVPEETVPEETTA